MSVHLDSRQRLTLENIFKHPTGGNVEWRRTLSLLKKLETLAKEHNGMFVVTLVSDTEVFEAPRAKDIDAQLAVDPRRMLTHAGFGPDAEEPVPDSRHRDNGDGQWGAPG